MKIINAENAVVDIRKLSNYCLDADHIRGGHKARVFQAALAIDAADAEWLRHELLRLIAITDAKRVKHDVYGVHYSAKVSLTRQNRTAVINTPWLVRQDEDFPRFLSA